MKQSNFSFADGFNPNRLGQINRKLGKPLMAFDWDKAAEIIKEKLKLHPDLKAEAGLQGDWAYTGGTIFENGKPTNDEYTYLQSNWAKPTLILEWEGKPGDGVCALYDEPDSKLRLYCIHYGKQIIIVGSGGEKPKNIRALQENDKLKDENYLLREISNQITNRIKEKDIKYSTDGLNFIGDLVFDDEE